MKVDHSLRMHSMEVCISAFSTMCGAVTISAVKFDFVRGDSEDRSTVVRPTAVALAGSGPHRCTCVELACTCVGGSCRLERRLKFGNDVHNARLISSFAVELKLHLYFIDN